MTAAPSAPPLKSIARESFLIPFCHLKPTSSFVTKLAHYHLKNVTKFRPSLSDPVVETLIYAFITIHLDYCNGVLCKTLNRLQYVHFSTAKFLTRTKPWLHITPVHMHLHWLPVKFGFTFFFLTYKSLHTLASQHISDLVPYIPSWNLKSLTRELLPIPHSWLWTYGGRALSVAAHTIWNTLPLEIRNAEFLDTQKNFLKRKCSFGLLAPLNHLLLLLPTGFNMYCKVLFGFRKALDESCYNSVKA